MPLLYASVEAWPRIRHLVPAGYKVRLRFQIPLFEVHNG